MVYAPADAQASIGSAIDGLGKTDRSGKSASIKRAKRRCESASGGWMPGAASGNDDPSLKELTPAPAPLRQSMGPLRFELGVSASAVAAIGQHGRIVTNGNGDYRQQFDLSSLPVQDAGAHVRVQYQDCQPWTGKPRHADRPAVRHYVLLAQGSGACAPAPAACSTCSASGGRRRIART